MKTILLLLKVSGIGFVALILLGLIIQAVSPEPPVLDDKFKADRVKLNIAFTDVFTGAETGDRPTADSCERIKQAIDNNPDLINDDFINRGFIACSKDSWAFQNLNARQRAVCSGAIKDTGNIGFIGKVKCPVR